MINALIDRDSDEAYRGCPVCGGSEVSIRGRYPGAANRLVCPTCMADRLEQIAELAGCMTPSGMIPRRAP